MAVSPLTAASIIKSTLSYLSLGGGEYDFTDVRSKIAEKLNLSSPSDIASLNAHMQSANRVAGAGLSLEEATDQNKPQTGLPLDRSLNSGEGRYGYRVLVHVTDSDTLTSYTSLQFIYADSPLSAAAVRSRALDQWRQDRYDIDTDPKRFDVGMRVNATAEIWTAGRSA